MADERIPLLFDTDIGSDIDDAVALAYLLRHPRCELLGITTVSGEPEERARLASAVCRAAGREDVPIHSGSARPLLIAPKQPHAEQKSVLPRWSHREEFAPSTAVPFLQRTIRERPGEVALLAVGPLTNVGVLFAMDPEIPKLLKRLVLMAGVYTTRVSGSPRTEWNVANDPHAAAIVFAAEVPEIVAFGLDVTLRCCLEPAICRERIRGGPLDVVADMAEVWFKRAKYLVFHDPLAAVGIFEPKTWKGKRGTVEVELVSPRAAGATYWKESRSGPVTVALEVDADAFFESYFSVFGGD